VRRSPRACRPGHSPPASRGAAPRARCGAGG
jgi:hypothetical protein